MHFGIDTLAFAILPVIAIFGAWFSKKIKKDGGAKNMALMMGVSIISSASWIVISRYTKMSLATATVIFDTIIAVAYFVAFMALGESVTWSQWAGAVLAICGMVLMVL